MRNPHAVAAIVAALRHVHGDDIARVSLSDGVSLAVIIDAVLSVPVANRVSVRVLAEAIESGDFMFTPDIRPLWHARYVYDRPGSMRVVDMAIATPNRMLSSTEVWLRLLV